jgi:hypothetical protein
MVVFDTGNGKLLRALPGVQDSDDLYYDPRSRRVYVARGEGHISVFQQNDPDHYHSGSRQARCGSMDMRGRRLTGQSG